MTDKEYEEYILLLMESISYYQSKNGPPTKEMPKVVACIDNNNRKYKEYVGKLKIVRDGNLVLFVAGDGPEIDEEIDKIKKFLGRN